MDIRDHDKSIYSLSTGEYLDTLPEGFTVLTEPRPPQREMACPQQISALVESVRDLVNAASSNALGSKAAPETFGVREAAEKMGCSPQQVRKLVHDGKLHHHWLGKNLRFRYQDLEQFWASQTRREADKTSSRKLSEGRDRKGSETNRRDSKASSLPTRREVDKLWR